MAGGMEAQDDASAWRTFDPETLAADGNAAIGADLEGGANTPNVRPPGARRGWTQDRSFFFAGEFPSFLGSPAQLAVSFVEVAMEAQSVDVRVGHFDLGNVFAGEIGREPALPELVLALDFAFGLGRWGIKETDVVESERPAELGQGVGIFGEKEGVIIDVDLERPTVAQESGGEEIEVGEEEFPIIKFGTDEHTTAIVEHIEHGKVQRASREPAMGRSVQLPEFADLGALPAAHGGVRTFGRGRMGQAILLRPDADLGAVEQSQGFRGREAVGAGRDASQAFSEEVRDQLGPSGSVVATRDSRFPQPLLFLCAGAEVIGGEGIEAAAG